MSDNERMNKMVLVAAEFGFKAAERGDNLNKMLEELKTLLLSADQDDDNKSLHGIADRDKSNR